MHRFRGTATKAFATAAVAISMLIAASPAASAATPQRTQAVAALRYLYGQLGSDGSIASSLGATEDTVISVADNGFDPATLTLPAAAGSAYDFLAAKAPSITTAGGAAKFVLAWVAAGKPAAVPGQPLLDKLNTAAASSGFLQSNGVFRNSDPSIEIANAFTQSLAVLADLAAGHSLPAHATDWLLCAQRPDGGFGYTILDSAPAPPASCGKDASDTNDSAIILQALGLAGVSSADAAATTYVHAAQQADGGFGFTAAAPSDPASDTVVMQALVAIGEDPAGPAWTPGAGHDPVADLETFADPVTGGFVFPGNAGPDPFTTSAVPQALALKPYGTATTFVAGASPLTLSSPTPSPTASPTSSVSSATSVPVPATGAKAEAATGEALVLVLLFGAAAAGAALGLRGRRRSRM